MKNKLFFEIILICIAYIHASFGAKILAIIGIDLPSHLQPFSAVLEYLVPHHNITFYMPKSLNYDHENITRRTILSLPVRNGGKMVYGRPCEIDCFRMFNRYVINDNVTEYRDIFLDKEVQKLINSKERYDLLLLDAYVSDHYFPVAHKLNLSVIQISPSFLHTWNNIAVQNSMSWEKDASFLILDSTTTLLGRVTRYIKNAVTYYQFSQKYDPAIHKAASEFIPNLPRVEEIMKQRTELIFVNTHSALGYSKSSSPAVVEIGGVHIGHQSRLPDDLDEFISSAEHGVIYFSLGTLVTLEKMGKDTVEVMLKTLGRLKQKILWKMKTNLENLPKNVKISSWFPQQDILRHSNVKLFITQGGMMSFIEACRFGVPVLVMPVILDQYSNADMAEKQGYGLRLDFCHFSEQRFYEKIIEILTNPKYKIASQQVSKLLEHDLLHSAEKINFWVDFILKNKGNSILRNFSSSETWLESTPADVFLVLASPLILCGITILYLLHSINKYITSQSKKDFLKKIKTN